MNRTTRRTFLNKSLATAGAAASAGYAARAAQQVGALSALGSSVLGANERIRVGVIGVGGRGRHDMVTFLEQGKHIECPVVCDVDGAMIAAAVDELKKHDRPQPDTVKDFRRVIDRKDIDIVLVATPDHWHALPTIHACQAGKDVFCEKPLANSIGEGHAMVEHARKHKRVVQMGTQWRLSKHHADAIDYVHSGKLGKIRLVRCWCALAWFKDVGKREDGPVPAGVDYDMWLGPAPKRPFNSGRFHFNFRWFWDYSGGLMTDWGVHLLNLAMWGMKCDFPKRVASTGGKFAFDDIAETPDTQTAIYDYGDFGLIWEHQAGTGHGAEGREHGVAFYGLNGTLIVDASGWEVAPEGKKLEAIKKQREEDSHACELRLVADFLDCVRTRQKPAQDIELGHRVSSVAHLGNLAVRTGRSIEYDTANMRVIGNDEANAMITRPYRSPWELPKA